MITVWIIVQLYVALFIAIYWHEIGHFGSKINIPRFPLLFMSAPNSRFIYGGLIFNAIAFIGIWHFKPQLLFLQLIGLMSLLHFLFYTIAGGLGIREKLWDILFKMGNEGADIKKGNFFAVALGIASLILFGEYYLTVINSIL